MSPDAGRDAGRLDAWWRVHRPHAPNLFVEALLSACDTILMAPRSRPVYEATREGDVRRILLISGHHGYYAIDEANQVVVVLRVWGARRLGGPPL